MRITGLFTIVDHLRVRHDRSSRPLGCGIPDDDRSAACTPRRDAVSGAVICRARERPKSGQINEAERCVRRSRSLDGGGRAWLMRTPIGVPALASQSRYVPSSLHVKSERPFGAQTARVMPSPCVGLPRVPPGPTSERCRRHGSSGLAAGFHRTPRCGPMSRGRKSPRAARLLSRLLWRPRHPRRRPKCIKPPPDTFAPRSRMRRCTH
jgi:hypothetical protein